MKESKFYEKLAGNKVKCNLCNHYCQIDVNNVGICGVRQNQNGKLISLNYGHLITEAVDPIEKKPIFHFMPGSRTYSIATIGCNLRCDNCQNWQISQSSKSKIKDQRSKIKDQRSTSIRLPGYDVKAEEVVDKAIEAGCQSISYTYTEPTIFAEFAIDCMKLARQKGLSNVWVSNGYMSRDCLNVILPYLDAINIDLKFFEEKYYLKNCGCHLEPIKENLKYLSRQNILLEVTTLLIPGLTDLNDQPKRIAEFIVQELSVDVPWHISRFSPQISYKMQNGKATSDKIIDEVYQIGKKSGLNFIYVGNVWNDKRENTFCPKCDAVVIKRAGYQIMRYDDHGKCQECGYQLALNV